MTKEIVLKVSSHKDEGSKEFVKRFCGQVFMLRVVRHMYEELFEKEDSSALMEKTASSFFSHLNTILQNYLLLEFAKISDLAVTRSNENFTVDNLVLSIDWPQDIQERLRTLNNQTMSFRSYVA